MPGPGSRETVRTRTTCDRSRRPRPSRLAARPSSEAGAAPTASRRAMASSLGSAKTTTKTSARESRATGASDPSRRSTGCAGSRGGRARSHRPREEAEMPGAQARARREAIRARARASSVRLAVVQSWLRPSRAPFVPPRPVTSNRARRRARGFSLPELSRRRRASLTRALASLNNSTLRFSSSLMRSSFVFSRSAHFLTIMSLLRLRLSSLTFSAAHSLSRPRYADCSELKSCNREGAAADGEQDEGGFGSD